MHTRLLIGAALSVWLARAEAANGIPFSTPTATTADTVTATPTPSATTGAVIENTPTQTAVPATGTATASSTQSATSSPTQSSVPTPTIALLATSVKSGKSNSSDRLVAHLTTASTSLSGPRDTKTVYQTPPSGDFILTQICVSPDAEGGILVSATGLGAVAHLGAATRGCEGGVTRRCESFDPGVILAPDSEITCSTFEDAPPGRVLLHDRRTAGPALG